MRRTDRIGESVGNPWPPDFYDARRWLSEVFVREIESYVVRVYRRDGEALAGLVEQVHSGRTAPFATAAELSDLLSGRCPFGRRPTLPAAGTTDTIPCPNDGDLT